MLDFLKMHLQSSVKWLIPTYLWSDVTIKVAQIFPKFAQRVTITIFASKLMFYKKPKSCKIFGLLLLKKLSNKNFQKSSNLVTLVGTTCFIYYFYYKRTSDGENSISSFIPTSLFLCRYISLADIFRTQPWTWSRYSTPVQDSWFLFSAPTMHPWATFCWRTTSSSVLSPSTSWTSSSCPGVIGLRRETVNTIEVVRERF